MRPSNMSKPLVVDEEEFRDERMALTNTKLTILIFLTFGLIIAIYAMSTAIQLCQGTMAQSYEAGGGILLALFLLYAIVFGVLWFFGSRKRQDLKRQAVEKAIARDKAQQALQNLE